MRYLRLTARDEAVLDAPLLSTRVEAGGRPGDDSSLQNSDASSALPSEQVVLTEDREGELSAGR